MIRPLLSSRALLSLNNLLPHSQLFPFAIAKTVDGESHSEVQQLDRAQNFYRNTIRRININEKGRGKFTEHHLLRLTKITEKSSQLPLLFEGYYNYLGHFTIISNKTVDRMLEKALSFEDAPLEPVLQIFGNHNYLGYFPAYKTTLSLLAAADKSQQFLTKLIQILTQSPLIKFNRPIVDKLMDLLQANSASYGLYSSISKLLIQRSALKITEDVITPRQILQSLVASCEERASMPSFKVCRDHSYLETFLDLIRDSQQEQTDNYYKHMTVFSIIYGRRTRLYDNLVMIKAQKQQQQILNIVKNCPEPYFKLIVRYFEDKEASRLVAYLREGRREESEQSIQE